MEQKLNSNSSAGTAADSDLQTIVTTSADIAVNPLLAAVLSKAEAIELMKQGKRVTHIYFLPDEWITMRGNIIYMELGQDIWATSFWLHRTDPSWETDWSLYGS